MKINKKFILIISVVSFLLSMMLTKSSFLKNLSKKPEAFTELYFTDHLSLPKIISLYDENSFQFTIHNLEKKDMFYSYEVVATNGCCSKTGLISCNKVFLKNNETKTITEKFSITRPFDMLMVQVNLVNKNQEIHFVLGEK